MITLQERVHGTKTPSDWKLNKLHRVFRVRKGYKNIGMRENNLLSLSYGHIINKDIDSADGLLPESFETYQIVEPGNIVMRLTDLQNDKRSLRQGLVKERGIITSAYDALELEKGHDPRFWSYALLALDLAKYYYSMGGGVRQSIKFADFPNDWVATPSKNEQISIADFLDHEIGRIDQLLKKKRRLAKVVDERRADFILSAVTKGLDPTAALAPSGLEWAPKLPSHWTPTRLKFLGQSIIGLTYSPDEIVSESQGTPVIRANNIQAGKLEARNLVYVAKAIPPRLILREGDIVICSRNGSRNLIGKNAQATGQFVGMTFGAFNTVFRSKYADFIYWVLQSPVFSFQAGAYLTSTINQLTVSTLGDLVIPMPPRSEQEQICRHIEAHVARFDALSERISQSIRGLAEFRTSLITEAVTGKISPNSGALRNREDQILDEIQEAMGA